MERKSKQGQIIIKICCLIAAFVLWLYIYNVENPSKDRIVTVPVKIVNQESLLASKLAPVIDGDVTIKITIRGNVSEIYSVKLDDIKLEADLSSLALKKGENAIPVKIKSVPSGIRILGSENLNVKIDVDELVSKSVPVKITLKGIAKSGFYAIPPEPVNKLVIVKGPSKTVNQAKYASAELEVTNADKDITGKIPLVAEGENGTKLTYLIVDPENFDITIPVKKIKTVGINVRLSTNLDSNTLVKSVMPAISTVEIAGDDDVLSKISSLDTEPVNIRTLGGHQTIDGKLVIPKGVAAVNNLTTVKLNVTYNAATVKTLAVPIRTKNLSSGLNAVLSVSNISLSVSGPEGLVGNLTKDNIDCYVELQGVASGTHEIQVNVKLPEGISKDSVNPSKITVVLSNIETGGQ